MPLWILPLLLNIAGGMGAEWGLRKLAGKVAGKALNAPGAAGVTEVASALGKKVEGTAAGKMAASATGYLPKIMRFTPTGAIGGVLGAGAMLASNLAFMAPGILSDLWGSDTKRENDSELESEPARSTQSAHGASDRRELAKVFDEASLRSALAQYTGDQSAVDNLMGGSLL